MRGCAETEEANAVAGFDPGHANAAKADDTGTEKRSGVQVVQVRRERIDEVGTCHCVLRITAVDGVSSKDRRIAEVLEAAPAIRTISVDTADPRNTYAGSGRQGGRCTLYDFAYDLMAGDEWLHSRWQFSLDDVKIGAAHTASPHLYADLSGTGLGYAISFAYQSFDNRAMYGLMLFVLLVAVIANAILYVWEGRLARRRLAG